MEKADYKVYFLSTGRDWFYTNVSYQGTQIAQRACCKSYPRSVRWANQQIKKHRKAILNSDVPVVHV